MEGIELDTLLLWDFSVPRVHNNRSDKRETRHHPTTLYSSIILALTQKIPIRILITSVWRSMTSPATMDKGSEFEAERVSAAVPNGTTGGVGGASVTVLPPEPVHGLDVRYA
jgi:hypothetical protein